MVQSEHFGELILRKALRFPELRYPIADHESDVALQAIRLRSGLARILPSKMKGILGLGQQMTNRTGCFGLAVALTTSLAVAQTKAPAPPAT